MLQHGDLIKVRKTTDPKRRLREARGCPTVRLLASSPTEQRFVEIGGGARDAMRTIKGLGVIEGLAGRRRRLRKLGHGKFLYSKYRAKKSTIGGAW
jgi:hypothetical protein